MCDELDLAAQVHGGYLLRRHLLGLGYSDTGIARAVRAGILLRVRHGTYVMAGWWRTLGAVERHRVITRSVLERMGSDAVASHVSAAALHGLDLWGVDLSTVHVTRLDGVGGRTEAGVRFHENLLPDADVTPLADGLMVTSPLRAAIETSAVASVESGMVTISSLLREHGPSDEAVEDMRLRSLRWPGARAVRLAVLLSDGLLQSVGEVRSLHMMWRHDVPRPELQHRMRLGGAGTAFLDFWWELARHAGEFDGMVKYGRLNPFGLDPSTVLVEEKAREDAVRASPAGMSRWVWGDLDPAVQPRTASRLLAGLEQSRRLYGRHAVVIDLG